MTSLRIPARKELLGTVNGFLAASLPEGFAGTLHKVELAVEELLINICSYAYPQGGEGWVQIECHPEKRDGGIFFCVRVRDWGPPFNPFTDARVPDLGLPANARPVGGLGIHLIKSVTARQGYERRDGANVATLYFAGADA